MDYQVVITELALSDIRDIFRYISVDLNEPVVASRMKDEILKCVDSLAVFPLRNKRFENEKMLSKEIRRAIVKNYSVFYCVDKSTVLILRVLYNRREWQDIL